MLEVDSRDRLITAAIREIAHSAETNLAQSIRTAQNSKFLAAVSSWLMRALNNGIEKFADVWSVGTS